MTTVRQKKMGRFRFTMTKMDSGVRCPFEVFEGKNGFRKWKIRIKDSLT